MTGLLTGLGVLLTVAFGAWLSTSVVVAPASGTGLDVAALPQSLRASPDFLRPVIALTDDRDAAEPLLDAALATEDSADASFAPIVEAVMEASSGSPSAVSSPLEARLASWPGGLVVEASGAPTAVFGFAPDQAREILYAVTKDRSLSADYRPRDLVGAPGAVGSVLMRAVAVADFQELRAAARADGRSIVAVSGYRSYATQTSLYEGRVRDRLAQGGGNVTLEEARQLANRGTALPGHSQHQLGTALDVSTPVIGNRIGPPFSGTAEALWLRERAWEFGFVLPYTELGQPRTGYIPEPWHIRWVGKPLAAFLMSEGYLDSPDLVADDYLEALLAMLDRTPSATAERGSG
jgi:LAS superfamily LD-carboxypeptidase LdcB